MLSCANVAAKMNRRLRVRFLKARRYELLSLGLFLLTAGGLIATTTLLQRSDGAHRVSMVMEDEAHAATMRHDALSSAIQSAVSDVLFLRELNALSVFLSDPSKSVSDGLARELVSFARTRDTYEQVRVLSQDGLEVVRIDRVDGSPRVAASSDLRYQGDQDYFREMTAAPSGIVYVSRLDLDIEDADVDRPLEPVLRFGVSVGIGDNAQAYLVMNMQGIALLEAYDAAHPNASSSAYLLDDDGYWLRGPSRDVEWGFVLRDRSEQGFQYSYPTEWGGFLRERVGQFETENGLFTFDTVVPARLASNFAADLGFPAPGEEATSFDGGPSSAAWLSVSVVSPETLRALRSSGFAQIWGWNVVGILVLATGSYTLTRRLRTRAELFERTSQEREVLASTLEKYMHKEIRDRVLGNPSQHGRLGGDAQDVVVLFADIRGFTRFTETNDPEYVVSVLNRMLTELSVPLRAFDGILDKYIGDGFLAFFEAKPGSEDAAQRAVEAARMMQRAFRNLWHDAPGSDLRELGLGIGVSAGRVVVGNIGSEKSMNYTVVGDAVNVASRLEGMAKSGEILLCGAVRSRLQADSSVELIHAAGRVRGRGKTLEIYKLV